MQRDTALNLVTGAATLVGGGMILTYDPATLSTVSVPGVTVFVCFLIVALRLGWNWYRFWVDGRRSRREGEE